MSLLLALLLVVALLPMTAMAEGTAWDGTTKTEPGKTGDVYQIGTGAELAWFVDNYITQKIPVSGVLTADINLGNHDWVAATNSGNGKAFNLDGQNHTVSGLKAKYGLIGAIGGTSKIQNLTVKGEVSGGEKRVGGIVGYVGGGTIENCVSYVNITVTGVTVDVFAGGIAGHCYNDNAVIKNCANHGTIQCSGNQVGGITGQFGKKATITGCYNTGAVSGLKYVGGIVGNTNSKQSTVSYCYNTGAVSGTGYVGGLIGNAQGNGSSRPLTVKDCYSTGVVTGTTNTGLLFGAAKNTSPTHIYYLSDNGTDANGTGLTASELKNADLDSAYFKSVCGGYPALTWQKGTKAHTTGTETIVPATCTTDGYVTTSCSECGVEYVSGTITALGHLYCEHAVTETCDHCAYDPAPSISAAGTLKRTCQREGCTVVKEETAAKLISYTVTLPEGEGFTAAAKEGFASPLLEKTDFSFTVTVKEGFTTSGLVVKANGVELKPVDGVYTIKTITEDQTVTVSGVVASSGETYAVTLPTSAGYTLSAQTESPVPAGGNYRFSLAVNEGYTASGLVVKANGTELTPENGVYTIYNITSAQTVTVSGVVSSTGESHTVTLTGGTGYTLTPEDGSSITVPDGGNIRFRLNILDGYEPWELAVKAGDTVLTAENDVYTIENVTSDLTVTVTGVETKMPDASITVPTGATLFVGSKPQNDQQHFVAFTEIQPAGKRTKDGNDIYYYSLTNGKQYNYRVSGEGYVTNASVFKKTANCALSITESDLKPAGKTAKTIDHNVTSNNGLNVADVWLNINAKNYLKLSAVGSTHQLVNLRNWETTNSETENYFIEPDYHYTVLDENGQTSNSVVTVSDSGLVTAVGNGTAIVLVTYDAINIPSAMGGPFFGAIWPENTGVFVVTVGAGDSGIATGMTINGEINEGLKYKNDGAALDAEQDVIYFTGSTGSYTFTPGTAGVSVSVANPTVTSAAMSFGGFTSVSGNEDGSFTVPLVEGRNIVKLEANGGVEYQVITAKKLTVTIANDGELKPGDPVSIKLDTVYHPINKLAGVYNYHATIAYTQVDGYEGQKIGGAKVQYNFNSSEAAQTISSIVTIQDFYGADTLQPAGTFIIPEDYTDNTLTLSGGVISFGGWGSWAGEHRRIDPTVGKMPNLNADSPFGYMGQLPDIVVHVKQLWPGVEDQIKALPDTITLANKDAVNAAKTGYDALSQAAQARISAQNREKLADAVEALSWLENPATGYYITGGKGTGIAVGEQAQVVYTIANDTETTYNAYHLVVTYDAEKLTYTGINTNATVDKDTNPGTLTISGYGEDRTCGTDTVILTFTGKAPGEAKVTITGANIDKSANAVTSDAPVARVRRGEAVITVGGYTVDLGDDFTGEGAVKSGESYTFTPKDPHYDYTIEVTMGGAKVEPAPTQKEDGSFTIENVTGNLVIRTASKTAKTYTVIVSGTGSDDVTYNESATYQQDYTFTVNKAAGKTYTVTVTVGGKAYTPTEGTDGKTYTISGSDVTGDIEITANKTTTPEPPTPNTTQISFTGTGASDVVGGTPRTATNGTDFTFEITKAEGYDYTVTLGTTVLEAGEDGKTYTIPGSQITGTTLTVNVEKTGHIEVNVSQYITLNEGTNMWLVTASGTVAEGKVLAYDGSPMFWSGKYNAYAYLLVSNKTQEELKTEATGKISESSAEKVTLAYDGDVNKTDLVDINDAQLTYDMYNTKYENFDTVSMGKFLEADMNGDKKVTVEDATAIISKIS